MNNLEKSLKNYLENAGKLLNLLKKTFNKFRVLQVKNKIYKILLTVIKKKFLLKDITVDEKGFYLQVDPIGFHRTSYNDVLLILIQKSNTKKHLHFETIRRQSDGTTFEFFIPINFLSDRGQLEQEWSVFVKINSKSKFRLTRRKLIVSPTLKQKLVTQRGYSNGYIFIPKTNCSNTLIVSKEKFTIDKLSHFINNVKHIEFKEDHLLVSGDVHFEFINDLSPDNVKLLIQKRQSEKNFSVDLQWLNYRQWKATVPYYSLSAQNGVLDFYLLIKKNNTSYKVRVKHIEPLNLNDIKKFIKHDVKGTISFSPYRTIKYNFSLLSRTETINLLDLKLKENKNSVVINGNIKGDFKFEQNSLIVFKERDGIEKIGANLSCEKVGNAYKFEAIVDRKKLYKLREKTFDVFIKHPYLNEELLLRLKTKDKTLKTTTLKEILTSENQIFHFYFYSTINNRLSFKIGKPTLIRSLDKAYFKKTHLFIDGFAYLIRKNLKDCIDSQLVSVVIRNRETEKEIEYHLENYKFKHMIHLEDLKGLLRTPKDILDIYIKVKDGEYINERKLGFDKYSYRKDEYLSKTTTSLDKRIIEWFLTLTPRGNIKIEVFQHKKQHILLREKINKEFRQTKDVWIVGERPDTAQDTGYYFFKYMRENHPDQEVYYAIEPGSKDLKNLEPLGNILLIGSEEHVQKCLKANAFFCSHDIDYILPFKSTEMRSYREGLKVFLQHGVLGRKNVEYHKKFYKYPFNIFCVSSIYEKEMVVKKFGYDEKEVFVTGLSRFDNLLDNNFPENRILLIPTWREWLNTKEKFYESEYFARYYSLLTNYKLHDILEKNDLILDFYPHYRMQHFIKDLSLKINERINLVQLGERKVQDLLKSSKLMITDYSSVSFDFNYQGKPVIFYHFDFRQFFSKGILREKDETFIGDIVNNEEQLIRAIEYYINNNFKEKDIYKDKKYLILSYIDQKNCKRIYQISKNYNK
ncbi:CDP-glycerol glycerophosphotransferase (TagB/SpsB family) [Melghiribacillus thermohalophilus]|uniref:CDP-glycerol glycerophosphotransferase (TagB/SpsB family) n=1 Tax=Melghiribacillus thermohalophilus TaxID=1324956 RepID=A0A4R3MWM6_9BACI|nr:CDP-glycerol glycerophosphotransferase family protein [Melghiribacillus thermohalophilus]TCT19881.1 CDP-glycerol glycerophosphotransferase (TagB/SpsB family) [Melghiribacillus thermohalophilus]